MTVVKIKVNRSAIGEILRSKEVAKWVDDTAEDITSEANSTLKGDEDGYETSSMTTNIRHRAHVWAETPYAYHSNIKNNTLMKIMLQRGE